LNSRSENDSFAWVYNRHWGPYAAQALAILDKLVTKDLPEGARILDLCCGTGQLAHILTTRGYQVIGIDASEEMLHFSRKNAPDAEFILADARHFKQTGIYDCVISTYDSLNFIMSLEDLVAVFQNVHAVLLEGGIFLFDLNTETGYLDHWDDGTFDIVEDDLVCIVRSTYDSDDRLSQFDLTIFRQFNEWQRSDLTFFQRYYPKAQVISALENTGFTDITVYGYQDEMGLTTLTPESERMYFICRKVLEKCT